MTTQNSRIRTRATLAAIASLAFAGTVLGIGVGAAAAAPLDPISSYADHPPSLPAGCPDGPGAFVDLRFDNGRGDSHPDLASLPLQEGDRVTMSWTEVAASCQADDGQPVIAVTLAAYTGGTPVFDPALDQRLLPGWVSCGMGTDPCARQNGRDALTMALPTNDIACDFQIDAVLGAPLAIVGPGGSYYTAALRGDARPTMLVGATYVTIPCLAAPTPTSPSPTSGPAPTVPTTAAPGPVAPPTGVQGAAVSQPTPAPAGAQTAVLPAAVSQPLPATGSSATTPAWWLGAGCVAAGVVALLASTGMTRRAARRRAG